MVISGEGEVLKSLYKKITEANVKMITYISGYGYMGIYTFFVLY